MFSPRFAALASSLCVIPFFARLSRSFSHVGSARKLFKKLGAIVTEIDISTEAYSTIQSVFENADVIYFTGGNSFFLMDQLRKTGADGLLKKELANGKLMIGESAGAIICAPSIQYIEQMDGMATGVTGLAHGMDGIIRILLYTAIA